MIDKKSKRIIDGVHRYNMYKRLDKNMEVEVVEKQYKDEAEMFWHAMRLNADHGKGLTPFDRAKCIAKSEQLGLTKIQTATALLMTLADIGKLKKERMGKYKINGKIIHEPLKRTICHLAGEELTENQWNANEKLSGMNQQFYVNQLIIMIESNLLNRQDKMLLERLTYLGRLISKI